MSTLNDVVDTMARIVLPPYPGQGGDSSVGNGGCVVAVPRIATSQRRHVDRDVSLKHVPLKKRERSESV